MKKFLLLLFLCIITIFLVFYTVNKIQDSKEKIDLVYLWVNGNDPNWLIKKKYWEKKEKDLILHINGKQRYNDHDDLKYSLRSVEKNMPWVNKIYIVTDNQVPEWLNTNHPKIQIVDHKQIIPEKYLPTFKSATIQFYIYNIPDLSEKFIYADDDYLAVAKLSPKDFFKNGKVIDRRSPTIIKNIDQYAAENKAFIKKLHTDRYEMISKHIGEPHYPHHNMDGYLKSDYKEAMELFADETEYTKMQKFRTNYDTQIRRFIINDYMIYKGHAIPVVTYGKQSLPKWVVKLLRNFKISTEESFYALITKTEMTDVLNKKFLITKFMCLNDTHYTNERGVKILPQVHEKLFPKKSKFEKAEVK